MQCIFKYIIKTTILPLRKHLRLWFPTLLFLLKLGNFPPYWGKKHICNFQDYLGKTINGCIMKHPVFIITISKVIRNPESHTVDYSETVNNCCERCEAWRDLAVKSLLWCFSKTPPIPSCGNINSPPFTKWSIFAFLISLL